MANTFLTGICFLRMLLGNNNPYNMFFGRFIPADEFNDSLILLLLKL